MRVLAIGAHPDDVELGAGGTLAKHIMAGDVIQIRAMGHGRNQEQANAQVAAHAALAAGVYAPTYDRAGTQEVPDQQYDIIPLQQFVWAIEDVVKRFNPDIIYTHHPGDRNKDHRIVADAVLTACRPLLGSSVKRILSFEVPSSTEWGTGFAPNVFVDISGEPQKRKMRALECYASEMREFPHPRSTEAILALAAWRGATAGVTAAEAFMLLREVA